LGGTGGTGGSGLPGLRGADGASGLLGQPGTAGIGGTGGSGGAGGMAGSARGGGILLNSGAVTVQSVTFFSNSVVGGAGGIGANGGPGGTGDSGGAIYVGGGQLTLVESTVFGNTSTAGAAGSNGASGPVVSPVGGGIAVTAGIVTLDNDTIANNQAIATGTMSSDGGGVYQASTGSITANSTLFAGNMATMDPDFAGNATTNFSLFEVAPTGTILGSNNLFGVSPQLDPMGLRANGGPTDTVALLMSSPAIGMGDNPLGLLADQRGFGLSVGLALDIGAYQTQAVADTQPPTATLTAVNVDATNAAVVNPYTFTLTFADDVALSSTGVPYAVVLVTPPGGAPITATLQSVTPSGPSDGLGNAQKVTATYSITPPGGSWVAAPQGTYTVTLGGLAVSDLAGNSLAAGPVGSFVVNFGTPTSSVVPLPATAPGSSFMVSWSGQAFPGGPEIASYDVYVSTNGGTYVPFVQNTTATSAMFVGQVGNTYSLYSVATDAAGNRQATPSGAQATTTVPLPPPPPPPPSPPAPPPSAPPQSQGPFDFFQFFEQFIQEIEALFASFF
jgi:hypothetical protein